ncbi:MAG: chromate transporter [Lachnospiraceae bacterium]|jgi:chromate transporter|nr:chromate transporter [Lachnospiraceae bacterium]
MHWKELWQLFAVFFRIGGLTFGGGLTMLPLLKYELVQKNNWISEEDLIDCYAIGQCTPGIIAVNTATFVGYKRKGIPGGIMATLGMVSPSLIIVSIIASFFQALMDNIWFQHAVMGIKGVVCALMLNTVITLAKKSLVNFLCVAVCIIAFLLAQLTPVPTIAIVVAAGIFGVITEKVRARRA